MHRLFITALLASVAIAPAYAGKKDKGDNILEQIQDQLEDKAFDRYEDKIERLEDRLEGAGDDERQRIENIIDSVTDKYEAKWGELPEEPPPEEPEPVTDELWKDDFNRDGGLGEAWKTSQDGRAQCINCFAEHPLLDANGHPVLNPDGTPVIVPGQGVLGLQQVERVSNWPTPGWATRNIGIGENYDFFTLSYDYGTTVSSSNSKLRVSWSIDETIWTDVAAHTLLGGDMTIWPNTSHASFTIQNNDFERIQIRFQAEGEPWIYVDNISLTGSYTPALTQ
jgi:hypothetical protein